MEQPFNTGCLALRVFPQPHFSTHFAQPTSYIRISSVSALTTYTWAILEWTVLSVCSASNRQSGCRASFLTLILSNISLGIPPSPSLFSCCCPNSTTRVQNRG